MIEIISLLFILLFVYAAVSKLTAYQQFKVQLGQSPLLTSFPGFVAWFIPLTELATAMALTTQRYRKVGFYASLSIMTLFTSYIFVLTRYSEYVPCSCGGILQKMSWDQHLLFNIVFTVFALTAIIMQESPQQNKPVLFLKTI
jgi:uncharacterized membrane protein YhaH (DUF805 family)